MNVPNPDAATLILASASPRRRRLLRSSGVSIEVQPSEVPEAPEPGESPRHYVRRMADDKCRAVAEQRRAAGDQRPVLGADTTVVLDDGVLEKPLDREDARRMLEALSGRTHRVITAFCLRWASGAVVQREVETEVTFRRIQPEELSAYLESGEWADKAGGYAIQGGAAGMVLAIRGSYTNVVGLPLAEVLEALRHGGEVGR